MNDHRVPRLVLRLSTLALAGVLGLVLAPAAAHADSWRTASATGSGPTPATGAANARSNAIAELHQQARQAGEPHCTAVTASATHAYTAPDGSAYVYNATATGFCSSTSPYQVVRSAASQGGGTSPQAALADGENKNRSTILSAGVDCINWSSHLGQHIYTAPGGAWYIYQVNTSAICTN